MEVAANTHTTGWTPVALAAMFILSLAAMVPFFGTVDPDAEINAKILGHVMAYAASQAGGA